MRFDRITFDPSQMNGQPCIRGMRIPIATLLRCLANGMTFKEILDDYRELESEDITQALQYAAQLAEDRLVPVI